MCTTTCFISFSLGACVYHIVAYCCHNPNQWKNSISWVHWCSETSVPLVEAYLMVKFIFTPFIWVVVPMRSSSTLLLHMESWDIWYVFDIWCSVCWLVPSWVPFAFPLQGLKTPRFVEVLLCPPGKWNGPSMRSNLWNGGPRKGLQVSKGLNFHLFPVLGDGHQSTQYPIVGLYTHYKDFLLKVGWPSWIWGVVWKI